MNGWELDFQNYLDNYGKEYAFARPKSDLHRVLPWVLGITALLALVTGLVQVGRRHN